MDIRELKYFLAVVEKGSISRAADSLYIAQSSLSKSIKILEAEFGTTLFVRTSTGVRLTNSGKYFLDYAKRCVINYHNAVCHVNDLDNRITGQIDLGISSYRGRFLLPDILSTYNKAYPEVSVIIHEHNSIELERLINKGELNIALVAEHHALGLYSERVLEDEVVVECHKNHPLTRFAKPFPDGRKGRWIDLKDTEPFEYILSDSSAILGNIATKLFEKYQVIPRSKNTNITASFAVDMARSGLGLCFNYKSCTHYQDEMCQFSIGKEREILNLALIYPPDTYRSKATKTFAALMKEEWSKR